MRKKTDGVSVGPWDPYVNCILTNYRVYCKKNVWKLIEVNKSKIDFCE